MAAFQTLLGLGTHHAPATYRHITTRGNRIVMSAPYPPTAKAEGFTARS